MLTARREQFAAGLAEGLSQSAAYRRAFPSSTAWRDATVWTRASELAADGVVKGRVAEIGAKAAAASEFTVEQHLRTLIELRDEARAVGQFGSAVKAEELRGRCAGFYAERLELSGKDGGPVKLTW